jgi:hypothetical protein
MKGTLRIRIMMRECQRMGTDRSREELATEMAIRAGRFEEVESEGE